MGFVYGLSDLSLDDLVAAAQAHAVDDTEEMAEMLRRFEGAVWKIAHSVTADANLQHDAAPAARLGLVKAVRAHKLGTAGFTAYAWRYMRGEVLRTVKALQTQEISVDPTQYGWPDQPPPDAAPDTTFEIIDLMSALTAQQQLIAKVHYIDMVSFKDIAVQLRISKPAVTQRFAVIHRTLRTAIEGTHAA